MNFSMILICLLTLAQNPMTQSQTYSIDNGACKQLDKEVYEATNGACHISGNNLDCLVPKFHEILSKPTLANLAMACNKEIPENSNMYKTQSIIKIAEYFYATMECDTIQHSPNMKVFKKVCTQFKKNIEKNRVLLSSKQPNDTTQQTKRFAQRHNR